MKAIVLGAGVIGVTTAYFLAKRGYDVTVIERHEKSAMETSFANGGQLSYSHAEPWATPEVLPKIFKWMFKEDAPLVFNPTRVDFAMWKWGLKFLQNCTKEKANYNTENTLRLALYSKSVLENIIKDTGVEFYHKKLGILHIFADQKSIDSQIKQAEFQKKFGCDYKVISKEECIKREPTLKHSNQQITGGIFYPIDESGDICMFTQNLSDVIASQYGVKFEYNTGARKIIVKGSEITGVDTEKGIFNADKFVVSLGSYSPILLNKIGIKLPIYPMKGYSISIPTEGYSGAPEISITDQSKKIVYSRLGNILRVAGTAEFAGHNDKIRDIRVNSIIKSAQNLFPGAGDFSKLTKWACLRPQTPQGSPIIGKTKYDNLFLNTGHGTLGWTLAAGSAKAVADVVEGKEPVISLRGISLAS